MFVPALLAPGAAESRRFSPLCAVLPGFPVTCPPSTCERERARTLAGWRSSRVGMLLDVLAEVAAPLIEVVWHLACGALDRLGVGAVLRRDEHTQPGAVLGLHRDAVRPTPQRSMRQNTRQ